VARVGKLALYLYSPGIYILGKPEVRGYYQKIMKFQPCPDIPQIENERWKARIGIGEPSNATFNQPVPGTAYASLFERGWGGQVIVT